MLCAVKRSTEIHVTLAELIAFEAGTEETRQVGMCKNTNILVVENWFVMESPRNNEVGFTECFRIAEY